MVEILLVVTILAILVLAIFRLVTLSIYNTSLSRNQALATKYAQEWIEQARYDRETQPAIFFADANNGCNRGPEAINSASLSNLFTAQRVCTLLVDSTNPTKKTMHIEVTVEWQEATKEHSSKLVLDLTNWGLN